MRFVNEKTTEDFKFKETWNYNVTFNETIQGYVLLLDGCVFTTLNNDQAKLLLNVFEDPKELEANFASCAIEDTFVNLQPKAACFYDYERPTGEIEF